MKKISAFLMAIAVIIGCQPTSKPSPIGYRETPHPTGTQYCSVAERHLASLCSTNPEENLYCCQTVASTKKGKSFTQFCEETQNSGISLDPECLSKITSCSGIDKCLGTTHE